MTISLSFCARRGDRFYDGFASNSETIIQITLHCENVSHELTAWKALIPVVKITYQFIHKVAGE